MTRMDAMNVHNRIRTGEWFVLIFFIFGASIFAWMAYEAGFRLPLLIFVPAALACCGFALIGYQRSMSWTHLSLLRDQITIHFRGGRQLEFPIPASIIRIDRTKGARDFALTLRNGSQKFYLITQRIVERELFDEWIGSHLKIGDSDA